MFSTSLSFAADIGAPGCIPAVSGFNGKLDASGGYLEDDDDEGARFQGVASFSMPVGCLLGIQVDVGGGDLDGDEYFGVQGHVFFRDPESYLLGVTAHYVDLDGDDVFRVGPEAELYLDSFTISGVATFEMTDGDLDDDDFVGGLQASFYATEDFALTAGYRHFLDTDAAAVGFEYQPASWPGSIYADAMIGTDDYLSIVGGVRFYWGGEDKSLIRRHREDDPGNLFLWLRQESEESACPPGYIFVDGEGCVPD
ncbi:MAG: hypothetical protein ACREDX_01025 [Aestuariivirga sp.]